MGWLVARDALGAERPDVVHLHSARAHALGAAAAWSLGLRTVVASRRVAFPPRGDVLSRLKFRLPVARWLCVSAAARHTVIAAGVPAGCATVVPSGVDLAALAAAAERGGLDLRSTLGAPAPVPLFATVGALTAEKNHQFLLEVAERQSSRGGAGRFVWIGEGPRRAALEHEVMRRGLADRVHLVGRRDDVPALLRQCDLLLVPSRNEGFCGVAVEAQALGLPVIATRVGGLPEVVLDGDTGVLVAPGDAGAMVLAIEALADPARRSRMAERGPANAARFSADLMADRTLAVYQDVVSSLGAVRKAGTP
jgi:glycosyltransferase involved in cell wall biosynthesis